MRRLLADTLTEHHDDDLEAHDRDHEAYDRKNESSIASASQVAPLLGE
jgi:hypothetical protein